VQLQVPTTGRKEYRPNDVNAVMMGNTGAHDRRLATGGPGALERRHQPAKSRFHLQSPGWLSSHDTFFIRGQTYRFQCTMPAVSRGGAWRWGFWLLQPRRRTSRHTPLG